MVLIFFELIRVAIGNQSSLSRLPLANEWDALFELAKKQSLVGITFVALQRMGAKADDGFATIGMSEDTYFTWAGVAAKVNVTNELVNRQCLKVQEELKRAGINSLILKGQSLALYYKDLAGFRQSGDIDVYVDCGREKAIEFARKLQGDVDWDYKHLHLSVFTDTEVEVHYMITRLSNPIHNRRLQKWFNGQDLNKISQRIPFADAWHTVPTNRFNAIYLLLRIYRHFFWEGVGMRQLMDYYFVLKARDIENTQETEELSHLINSFGMKRFASGIMWIMQHIFGLEDKYLLLPADEKEGKFILDEVLITGNFGKYDDRSNIKKKDSHLNHFIQITQSRMRYMKHYPFEFLWQIYELVYRFVELRWYRMRDARKIQYLQ